MYYEKVPQEVRLRTFFVNHGGGCLPRPEIDARRGFGADMVLGWLGVCIWEGAEAVYMNFEGEQSLMGGGDRVGERIRE